MPSEEWYNIIGRPTENRTSIEMNSKPFGAQDSKRLFPSSNDRKIAPYRNRF